MTGTGFTPGSTIHSLTGVSLTSGITHDLYQAGITPSRIDRTGTFISSHTQYWFCTIGGTTAIGITYNETFPLACEARDA